MNNNSNKNTDNKNNLEFQPRQHHGSKNEQGSNNEQGLRNAGIQGFNNQREFISDQIDPKLTVNQLQTNEQVGLVSGMKTMVINQVPIVEKRDIVVGTQPKYEEQDVIIGNVPIIEKRDVVVGSKPVYGKKKVMVGHVPVVEKRDVVVGQRMVVEQELNAEEIKNRNLVSEPVHQQTTQHNQKELINLHNQQELKDQKKDQKKVIPTATTTTTTTTKNTPTQQPSVGVFKHGSRLLLKSSHDKFLSSDEDGKLKQSKDRGNAETWYVESLGGNLYGLKNSLSGTFLSSDESGLRLHTAIAAEEKWRVEMLEDGKYSLTDYKGNFLRGGHFNHMALSEHLSDDDKWTVESV